MMPTRNHISIDLILFDFASRSNLLAVSEALLPETETISLRTLWFFLVYNSCCIALRTTGLATSCLRHWEVFY